MKTIKLSVMLVLMIAATVAPAYAQPRSGRASGYAVCNPSHTQALGGPSTHASRGLSNAARHSPAVNPTKGGGTMQVVNPK